MNYETSSKLPAKRYQDELAKLKEQVKHSYEYFKPNYDRFNYFKKFVFDTSLRDEDIALLESLSKPQLEFNILEAYISRLLGEFSKQEPDIMVSADDENNADPLVIKVLEQHLRHVLNDSSNNHTRYEVYKDLLSGGFTVLEISTEYANSMSMNQIIKIDRVYDPTLCGFDKLARYSHKGDGQYCFKVFPKSKEEFKEEYPDIDISKFSFVRGSDGFNWAYADNDSKILLVVDYYKKKKERVSIVQVRDGRVMTHKKYKEMLASWNEFEAPPAIIGKPRMTEIEHICRYRFIENQVLEYEETDFSMLPLIFVDGNSVLIKDNNNGNIRQMTRPYVYQAKSAQMLKNYAGIAVANEIENVVQHKFIIKKEALPKEEEFLQAIKDIQKPSNVIVNAFYEEDPNQPIPEPIREIAKVPAPPEAAQAFTGTDSLIQNVLGSYDASLGINNNQLSGIAIIEAASQSNAAAMPYIVGFMQGLQRAAQIYVDLLPKYYKTPRTIPIIDEEGFRSYVKINGDDGLKMSYEANGLNVVVKAGASFSVQKSRTLMMVKEMMGMSPLFAQFIASKGINFVLDNMEGKGIEQLKAMVDEWTKEMEQQQQMAQQNNPEMIKATMAAQKMQQDGMLKNREVEAKLIDAQLRHDAALSRSMAEQVRSQADIALKEMDVRNKTIDMAHKHAQNISKHHHDVNQSNRGQ